MTNIERARRGLLMAATQADHWPAGHNYYWGRDLEGEWMVNPARVAEYGSPELILSRELKAKPAVMLRWCRNTWIRNNERNYYIQDLQDNPSYVASCLRKLAEDPEAVAGLAALAQQPADRSVGWFLTSQKGEHDAKHEAIPQPAGEAC